MASIDEKAGTGVTHRESTAGADTTIKTVAAQGVALADATEKQKPSPWTKNMFKVRDNLEVLQSLT